MPMNSMEEDALFEKHGWFKDLIQRVYVNPDKTVRLTFDYVMDLSQSPLGEDAIHSIVVKFGKKPQR